MESHYSIQQHFSGGSVLITGSSGYVGGLVLEKLLRSTDVKHVFVLLRPKKGQDVQQRLQKQLDSSPLMHLLRGNPVLSKVVPVGGDMRSPALGISPADVAKLQREVHTVIHCAADIRLEVGIQELLQTNYDGTRQLLELARTFDALKAFVHVSSAYTNMNAPPGSLVHESIYPLSYGDQLVDDNELVQELMSMPAHNANLRAEGLLAHWGFPNNYTLSKHLAEYMVADYQATAGLPISIVRPTLISSVARDPYPGYTGNYAGHVGATLAFMAGLFDSPHASNYRGSNVWDVIPSDVVAAVILAAAAALGQGSAGACSVTPTHIYKPAQQHHPKTGAAAGGGDVGGNNTHATYSNVRFSSMGGGGAVCASEAARHQQRKQHQQLCAHIGGEQEGSATVLPGALAAAAESDADDSTAPRPPPLLIIHCGSSTTYPLTIMESWNWGVEAYGAWPNNPSLAWGKCAGPMTASHEPDPKRAARHMAATGWKIWAAAKLLGLFKMGGVARKLTIGFESFKVINQPKTDVNLRFSTTNLQRLAALLQPAERGDFLLLWKPERVAANLPARGFSTQHTSAPAAAVSVFESVNAKHSSGSGGVAAAAAASPTPAADFVIRAALDGAASASSAAASSNSDSSSSSCRSSLDTAAAVAGSGSRTLNTPAPEPAAHEDDHTHNHQQRRQHGAVLSPDAEEAVRRMRLIPVEWRSFHINLGAFLYSGLFKMPLPATELPIDNPEIIRWLDIQPEDRIIRHQFVLYK